MYGPLTAIGNAPNELHLVLDFLRPRLRWAFPFSPSGSDERSMRLQTTHTHGTGGRVDAHM